MKRDNDQTDKNCNMTGMVCSAEEQRSDGRSPRFKTVGVRERMRSVQQEEKRQNMKQTGREMFW